MLDQHIWSIMQIAQQNEPRETKAPLNHGREIVVFSFSPNRTERKSMKLYSNSFLHQLSEKIYIWGIKRRNFDLKCQQFIIKLYKAISGQYCRIQRACEADTSGLP